MATKQITIEVPDSFTEAQCKEVQEFSTVKITRIVRANEVVAENIKTTNSKFPTGFWSITYHGIGNKFRLP